MPTHTTGTARSRRRERRAQARGDVHLDGRYSVTVAGSASASGVRIQQLLGSPTPAERESEEASARFLMPEPTPRERPVLVFDSTPDNGSVFYDAWRRAMGAER